MAHRRGYRGAQERIQWRTGEDTVAHRREYKKGEELGERGCTCEKTHKSPLSVGEGMRQFWRKKNIQKSIQEILFLFLAQDSPISVGMRKNWCDRVGSLVVV